MNLEGKVALITGGGTGIGAEIAKRFVADGAKICIVGRREEHLDVVADSLPANAVIKCSGDVTKSEDIERMLAAVLTFGGGLDVLVNCAGISSRGSVTEAHPEEWRKIIEVNLTGPFLLMQAVIPHMVKNGGGSIINISSLGGLRCMPNKSAYCTSKAGLIMLTQQAALDYGPENIRCNVVCPGPVKTSMMAGALAARAEAIGSDAATILNNVTKELPLNRPADPSEIAGICSYLASDDSSYMTGAVLLLDGGTAIVDAFGAAVERAIRG